jgi:hypothetical protein
LRAPVAPQGRAVGARGLSVRAAGRCRTFLAYRRFGAACNNRASTATALSGAKKNAPERVFERPHGGRPADPREAGGKGSLGGNRWRQTPDSGSGELRLLSAALGVGGVLRGCDIDVAMRIQDSTGMCFMT